MSDTTTDTVEEKPKRSLSPKTAELTAARANQFPVWIRCPKSGHEHFTGFSRAKLYELAKAGKIRSVSIREKSQIKGTRLFGLQSIFDYIESCERAAQNAVEPGSV